MASPYNINISYDDKTQSLPVEEKPLPKPVIPSGRFLKSWYQNRWIPRVVYVSFGVLTMVIWIIVIAVFAGIDSKLQAKNASADVQSLKTAFSELAGSLFYKGLLRAFDPNSGTLSVQWSAVTLDSDGTSFSAFPAPGNETFPLGLYRDVQGVFSQELTDFKNNNFQYFSLDNGTATLPLGVLGVHPYDAVDTDIDMAAAYEGGSILKQPIFGYPLEEWSGSIALVVTDLTDQIRFAIANDLPVNNTQFASTLSGVDLVGSVLNWKIESSSNYTADCFDINLNTCVLNINFTAKRPGIVKFVVIVVVIVNWLTTIVIFLITGETILLRRSYILDGTDFLGVCFAGLFALPTVRSILPGAPSQFGAVIDMIGILPNIVIVSLCTMTFAIARLSVSLRLADSDKEKAS